MSFDRPAKGLLVFLCDACDEAFEVTDSDADLTNNAECWDLAKQEGWRRRNKEHYCPGCAEYL